MLLELSAPCADELRTTLDRVVSDMSTELANTDNASYRRLLRERRDRIEDIRSQLEATMQV